MLHWCLLCLTYTDSLFCVLKAYQAFASRVSHLKRKLDALKATLPDLDDSPIPSPSADAPSPTGSESPFHGMELGHPGLDVSAMDDEAEPPAPSPLSSPGGSPIHTATFDNDDNRMVEDMDLSEEEADSSIIGEPWEVQYISNYIWNYPPKSYISSVRELLHIGSKPFFPTDSFFVCS